MPLALSVALGGVAAALAVALVLLERGRRRGLFEMLKRGKEQWEATFDAISEGIALVSADGVIRRSNTTFAELAGRQVTTVGGERLCHALFGEHEALAPLLRAAAAGGRPAPVVRRSATLNRVLRVAAAPVARAVDGASVVVVVEDITEQQALEAQLIQSEKMAAVGTLVSGVAHELNNPLTSIAGLSEFLLEQSPAGAPGREHLRIINEQADRAGHIVRDLLTFARKGPAEREPVDLGDVVQRTLALLGYDLRRLGVATEIVVAPSLPKVLGDRHQLQQVALNLLTNAVQAVGGLAPGRPRRVAIRLGLEHGRVALRVADTGSGLTEEVRAQMFSPFFTTKEPGEGTGLGLFVSYGIAESHGGTLTAEASPGQGAAFVLTLPAAGTAAAASPGAGEPPGPRRVLVVDDDPVVRQVVSALFTGDGHRVDAAVSGADALRLARTERYDLVLADRLASAGDEPFASALRRLPFGVHDRLVLSTSARLDGDDRPALGTRLLQKPFDLRELKRTAEEVFRLSEQLPDAKSEVVAGSK
ncbi:MAG TPA: ATP-binding protein [Gemmatimonadales bacterium]|nr:ATP-binding protein [Gemmatimonadales bacterium]